MALQAPGSGWLRSFKEIRALRRDPIRLISQAVERHGDLVRIVRLGPLTYYLIRHPKDLQRVLLDNHRNYSKDLFVWRNLSSLLGNGLLISEGDFWLRQRRIIQPAFHRERIARFAEMMSRESARTFADWERPARTGEPIEVLQHMMSLTLRIVAQALMSVEVEGESHALGGDLTYVLTSIMDRNTAPYMYLPMTVPTPANRRFKAAVRSIDEMVLGVIRKRRARQDSEADLLSMLMAMKDEDTGEMMSDAQLLDEVKTMILAGHETTANALAWTLYLLGENPRAQDRLRQELAQVLADRDPGLSDIQRLPYTKMVIQESMRIYPPAWLTYRRVEQDDVVGGFRIPKRSVAVISPYMTHRHPDFWPDPERFDPERFTPGWDAGKPRFAYFPFGGGPRQCIGNEFAMLESQIILASCLRRFKIESVPGHPVVPQPSVTLRPKFGIKVRVRA